MNNITIDIGVCTNILVDLTEFNFENIEKLILTIKNKPDVKEPAIIEREFTEPIRYSVIITAEESLKVTPGAVYDFDAIMATDGTRFKVSPNAKVLLREAVGDCIE